MTLLSKAIDASAMFFLENRPSLTGDSLAYNWATKEVRVLNLNMSHQFTPTEVDEGSVMQAFYRKVEETIRDCCKETPDFSQASEGLLEAESLSKIGEQCTPAFLRSELVAKIFLERVLSTPDTGAAGIPFVNGVLNLDSPRSFTLYSHEMQDFPRFILPHCYNPKAECCIEELQKAQRIFKEEDYFNIFCKFASIALKRDPYENVLLNVYGGNPSNFSAFLQLLFGNLCTIATDVTKGNSDSCLYGPAILFIEAREELAVHEMLRNQVSVNGFCGHSSLLQIPTAKVIVHSEKPLETGGLSKRVWQAELRDSFAFDGGCSTILHWILEAEEC